MQAHTAYRALLRCYPAAFRDEYGGQMWLVFDEQLGDVRRRGSWLGHAALWARAAFDTAIVAPKEHWHVIRQDLRYALRTMAASPGFTIVAVLSLALGIGGNTAIFSLWNGVLHASLPKVRDPHQLVMLTNPDSAGTWTGFVNGVRKWTTYEEFEQLRDQTTSFSGVMASQSSLGAFAVQIDSGAPEPTRGRYVSGGYFDVLGAGPAIGRLFTPADDRDTVPHVVISHTYWQRRFAGRPDVLGKTLTLDRVATATVIGVAAPGFIGETSGEQPDLWLPLRLQPLVETDRTRLRDTAPTKHMWLHVFGRLKPNVTAAQAEAQANAVFQTSLASFYGTASATEERRRDLLDQRLKASDGARGASSTRVDFSQSLTALLTAVGVLLLIACANLANLLLARATARKSEMALRLSLGASRGRLVRQHVTESLALAAMGGAAAIVIASLLHASLVRMMTVANRTFALDFSLSPPVVLFIVAVTIAAALLFGMLPAWQISQTDPGVMLKAQTRGAIGTRGQLRSGRLLVSVQLALSLPLIVGAGLLAQTVYNLQRANLGYPSDRMLLMRVDMRKPTATPRGHAVQRQLVAEIQALPGVRAASFSALGVFSGGGESDASIDVEGFQPKTNDEAESALDDVGPGYFTALGSPLIRGRDIAASDGPVAPKVVVINEAFAKRFFAGRDPVGLRLTTIDEETRTDYRVIGVARDARTKSLRDPVEPRFFQAAAQQPTARRFPTFLIRTAADPMTMATAVRSAVARVDPSLPILYTESLETRLAPLVAQDRATAQLAIVFGTVALVLAAIGLYGVLSYGIARRTGEMAIRIALGARPHRVISMIVGETLVIVAIGLALGGGLAYPASRLIDSRLYGIDPQDPLTLALAIGLLLTVALGAAYWPARRASRVDPMTALRQP